MRVIGCVLLLTVSTVTLAKAGGAPWLAGEWECTAQAVPAVDQSQAHLESRLSLNEDLSRFTRNSIFDLKTGLFQVPRVELNTVEEGTVVFSDDRLILVPTDIEMDPIKGELLVRGQFAEDLKAMLLEDEVSIITQLSENSFSAELIDYNQTNICNRIEVEK